MPADLNRGGQLPRSADDRTARPDFFVSYTESDQHWAEWIAWQLEEAGYRTVLQLWDFAAGSHLLQEVQRAIRGAKRTVVVLSTAYLDSIHAAAQWQAAWLNDPDGRDRALIVARVDVSERPGFLGQLVTVDLFGVPADVAKRRLLAAARGERGKPATAPVFPGAASRPYSRAAPSYPGAVSEVWNVPIRLLTFTGRRDPLSKIEDLLSAADRVAVTGIGGVTALHGLGGVGKTQLVIEYAHRHADDYTIVWWVDAERIIMIGEQLAALAQRLDLPTTGNAERDAELATGALSRRRDWLLIFDNVGDAGEIRRWLPSGGHVIITSRNPVWGGVASRLAIDVLPRDEAVLLLTRRIRGLPTGTADHLAEELGDLPLALEQAAAYIEQTGITATTFLARFQARRTAMLNRGEDLVYRGNIDTTWTLALDRLSRTEPAATTLMQLLAYLAPEPVPISLLTCAPSLLPKPLRERAVADDGMGLDDVLGAVFRYSMATRDGTGIRVHRLVAAVIRAHQTTYERTVTARVVRDLLHEAVVGNRHGAISGQQAPGSTVRELLPMAALGDPRDSSNWASWGRLLPHLVASPALHPEDRSEDLDDAAYELLLHVSHYLAARGDYRAARSFDENIYQRCTALFGPDHALTLCFANRLAHDLHGLGFLEAARTLNATTLERCRQVFGDENPETLDSANNLAGQLVSLGETGAARRLNERTFEARSRVLGANHLDTLQSANNLATCLLLLGQPQAARELSADTLARKQQALGPDHPYTLFSAATLGSALAALGEHDEARRIHERTLASQRRTLGPDHPWSLRTSSALARDLLALGDAPAARELVDDTLTRYRQSSRDDPGTHLTIENLEHVLVALGDEAEAKRLTNEAQLHGGASTPDSDHDLHGGA
ncbi:FxSxx-COOH system tetratricopeptide repeat protein [Frankia gtarii]|uniref:FxSxx-COOH system tetratricopeptide repeat protein n=1 Tax=Frankia gtarii TaxID=2950102 RepID=UPI0021C03DB4|nr:FxSxx-COOH system tetratricopeptide repeat protein [Frankia gtarii]